MFQVWETGEPDRFISEADTLERALDKVDTMCRLRHDQELANIAPTADGYRFQIRDASGAALATLDYHPDTSRTYQSIIRAELLNPGPA